MVLVAFKFIAPVIFPVVHVIKFQTGSVNEMWNDALKSEDSGWCIHRMDEAPDS